MVDKNKMIKVVNRNNGPVGYQLPELRVDRQFSVRAEKEVPFGELFELSQTPGGMAMLEKYLIIRDEEARKEILPDVEPEYFYTEEDIKRILTEASFDEFLDCLDFAPWGVIEIMEDLAVSLPVYDMRKREAIQKKTGLDITNAIENWNRKAEDEIEEEDNSKPKRRVNATTAPLETTTTTRRASAPKYSLKSE